MIKASIVGTLHTTSAEFLSRIIVLGKKLQETAKSLTSSLKEKRLPFSQINQWIDFAHIMFKNINKYPDLTHFQNMKEQDDHRSVSSYLQRVAQDELSEKILDKISRDSSASQSKPEFEIEGWLYKRREANLRKYHKECDNRGYTQKIREKGQNDIFRLFKQTEELWKSKIDLDLYNNRAKSLELIGEIRITDAIRSTVLSRAILSRDDGLQIFEETYNEIIEDIRREMVPSEYEIKTLVYITQMVKLHSSFLPSFNELRKEVKKSRADLEEFYINSNNFFTNSDSNARNKDNFSLFAHKVRFTFLNEQKIYNEFDLFNNNMNLIISFWKLRRPEFDRDIIDSLQDKVKIALKSFKYISEEEQLEMGSLGLKIEKLPSVEKNEGKASSLFSLIYPCNIIIKEIAKKEDVSSLFNIPENNKVICKNTTDFTKPFSDYVHRNLISGFY